MKPTSIDLVGEIGFGPAEGRKALRVEDYPDRTERRVNAIIIKGRGLAHFGYPFLTHSQPNGKNVN